MLPWQLNEIQFNYKYFKNWNKNKSAKSNILFYILFAEKLNKKTHSKSIQTN